MKGVSNWRVLNERTEAPVCHWEELWVLQQRQLCQMQLTKDICCRVLLLGDLSTPKFHTPPLTKSCISSRGELFSPLFPPKSQPHATAFFLATTYCGVGVTPVVSPHPPIFGVGDMGGTRHECGFSGKGFGSESTWQIHLRSHQVNGPMAIISVATGSPRMAI